MYAFPLPIAGRYIVTMLHPVTYQATAQKLSVDLQSVTLNLTAPRVGENSGERVGA
jgi:hypothetical protein